MLVLEKNSGFRLNKRDFMLLLRGDPVKITYRNET